jgi:2-dehydropantoate 2-reductase
VGGFLAHGLAALDGAELSVMARGAHLEAIRSDGLTLIRDGQRSVATIASASDNPEELGTQDVVFNCLKAHQSWASAPAIRPLLHETTSVVTCQNGVPWWYFHNFGGELNGTRLDAVDRGDRQWQAIGPHRIIGGVIYAASEMTAPGEITHLSGERFILGEPGVPNSQRAAGISALLQAAGFQAPLADDIRAEIWLKLWGNLCFNPISALTGATLDVVATDPGTREVARTMMAEAQAIFGRLGVTLGLDIDRRMAGAARVGAHRTSMLQDLQAGKAMEIDALVTAVQEMGRITGVATPGLDAVLALVQQLGRSRGLYPTYPADA